jgi:hypothetical protein
MKRPITAKANVMNKFAASWMIVFAVGVTSILDMSPQSLAYNIKSVS